MQTTCPHCQGQGTVIKNPCKKCRGTGRQKSHRKIKVTVPPGVDNGTRLRVSGEGEGGYNGGHSGDLFVEMRVKEDKNFERDGDNLYTEVKINYLHLMLGGEVEIPTVLDKTKLEIPQGTEVGTTLRIAGEGIPSLRNGRRGDLYVQVGVQFPEKLSKKEQDLLRELAKIQGVDIEGCSPIAAFFKKKK